MSQAQKFVLIGSGNLAWQLALRLKKQKQRVVQVYSRKLINAKRLAAKMQSAYTSSLKKINKDADIYIIAVSDDAIEEVFSKLTILKLDKKILLHTSGSISSSIIESEANQHGVIWPPQSISKNIKLDFSQVPLCVCSPTKHLKKIKKIAQLLSNKVYVVSDEQKAALHLACVFANNFSNHMIHLSKEICDEHKVNFKILAPIIEETFKKIKIAGPSFSQTGPAIRDDKRTLNAHLAILSKDKKLKRLYKQITESIQSLEHKSVQH